MSNSGVVRFNHQEMHKMFRDVRQNLNPAQKLRVNQLRDNISSIVRSCDTNIEVVIYMDDILEEPLECVVGKGENRLRITIQADGDVNSEWTSETWSKFFKDIRNSIKNKVQGILTGITNFVYAKTAAVRGAEQMFAIRN